MKIYALIGKSGTGKSFQAPVLASEKHIDAIIDDGLYIMGGTVIAGRSAKRQSTKIRAIKTALFMDAKHEEEVRKSIKKTNPASILLVGTSDKMVDQITARLALPPPDERVYIEDITSSEQRDVAYKQRNELGKHIIPAPTMQVKKDFSGYFLHPIRSIKDLGADMGHATERSVVRPTYSYLGDYSISDSAINDIIYQVGKHVPGLFDITGIYVKSRREGVTLEITVLLDYMPDIVKTAERFQKDVAECVGMMTALNIIDVNIFIKGFGRSYT